MLKTTFLFKFLNREKIIKFILIMFDNYFDHTEIYKLDYFTVSSIARRFISSTRNTKTLITTILVNYLNFLQYFSHCYNITFANK